MSNELVIVCVHVLNGQPVYKQSKTGDLFCEKCFKRYDSYGRDESGYCKIPKNENLSNLKTVCKAHAAQIKKLMPYLRNKKI